MFLRQDRDTTYPLGSAHSLISWVYPRVCGGTLNPELSRWLMGGLSPRVRGNLSLLVRYVVHGGSIPACAGEPTASPWSRLAARVYPRVCGGTLSHWALAGCARGLSPRVRGNRQGTRRTQPTRGSIPACAGEPMPAWARHRRRRVYPRVCGGTDMRPWDAGRGLGLSPRVRGNHRTRKEPGRMTGSIPACAGEPLMTPIGSRFCRVYPRVCGGTNPLSVRSFSVAGLSPRVRGNRISGMAAQLPAGSIPACAGGCGDRRPMPPAISATLLNPELRVWLVAWWLVLVC